MFPNKIKIKRLSLSARIMLVVSGLTIAVSAILGTILSIQSIHMQKEMVRNKTIEMAMTAAELIDGESLIGLEEDDKGTPAYDNAYNILDAFRTTNQGTSGELAFIYLCRYIGDDRFIFTIDPSDDAAPWGMDLEWTKALDSARKGVAAFDEEPYTDSWGTFYSAYAPIWNNAKDQVVMIVGVDVWADWFESNIWSSATSIIIVTVIAAVTGILIGFFITVGIRKRFDLLSNELSGLQGDVTTLISEIKEPIDTTLDESEQEDSDDDQVAKLRNTIRVTQKEIKEYIIYTKKQAYIDGLTHVNNRTAYVERIKQIDLNKPFTVAIFDINGLKWINDNYGHETGDKAISEIGMILKQSFDEKSIYRIGGDEFVIILDGIDQEKMINGCQKVVENLSIYNQKNNMPIDFTISKGVAYFDKNIDKNYASTFNRADQEMYKDKQEFYDKYPELKEIYHR